MEREDWRERCPSCGNLLPERGHAARIFCGKKWAFGRLTMNAAMAARNADTPIFTASGSTFHQITATDYVIIATARALTLGAIAPRSCQSRIMGPKRG